MDRPALGQIVFANPERRAALEAIVHPLVFERILVEAQASSTDIVVHDIPLLAESGRADTFDAVLVVDADEDDQLERMIHDRGWSEADARARMAAQATRQDRPAKLLMSLTTPDAEDLRERVTEVFDELRRLAAS
ncbi:MAG: dephospho-CoA kinase [Marmoricola sp.]